MGNLNLGQDVANVRERKQPAAQIVAKSSSLYQTEGIRRCGSLIDIDLSG